MANALSLLFKIGVDAGDAEKSLSSITTALKEGVFKGAAQGAKDFEKTTTGALERVGNSLQQTRSGLENLFRGDVLEGTTQLVKQFGVLAVGLGVVAAAALAAKKTIEGILDVAEKVGTDSKEDFEEFQKSIARVGGQVTLLDHALGQELLKSAGDVKSAFDNMFVKMLEKEGPALILLFQEIVKFINGPLTTASDNWVHRQVEGIIQFIALGRALDAYFNLPSNLRTFDMFQKITPAYIEQVRRELEGLTSSFQGATGTFDDTGRTKDHTKALKDLTQAQLEENEAARELALQRADAAGQEAEINRQLKAGTITAEEALGRRLAIQQNLRNAEDALLDAQQKRIDEDVKGEKRRTDAFEENANKRAILAQQDSDKQKAIHQQANEDQIKQDEDRLKSIDKILEKQKDLDAIIKDRARVAPPGAPLAVEGQVPGLPSDAEIQKGLDEAFKHYESFFERLKEGIANVAADWRDKLNRAIEELPTHIIEAFTGAFESLLDTFIKTGHTGPAVMKQFVSQVLQSIALLASQLAALAFGYALLMLAFQNYHDAALAAAAGIALTALAIGLGYASRAVAPSSASSSAGAGAGFGGAASEAPGTVTINQGAGAGLGIQVQQLGALNDIRNTLSTASPGDVVTRGAEQNPVAIGQANNEASRRDGSISREFLQISGLRTA